VARRAIMKAKKKAKRVARPAASRPGQSRTGQSRKVKSFSGKKVVLLSGGNPQIAMADGDAPVQAFIAAVPGWKSDLCRRLDTLIVKTFPDVRKAVKWNSPFYGLEGRGYFLAFHVFTRYVKVTFFKGAALKPLPPGPSKDRNTRYLDIHEHDDIDERQFSSWLKQAAALPGYLAPRS
jgi:hypothetical protein